MSNKNNSNFLESTGTDYSEELLNNFRLKKEDVEDDKISEILPKPGICVKTKDSEGKKIFVNICQGEAIPAPLNITEEELCRQIELDDDSPPSFKIPMSIGDSHDEMDKSNNFCIAYDIVINPAFLNKVKSSSVFEAFLMTVIIEGLESKFSLSLVKEWTVLKNRNYLGQLPPKVQNIKIKKKPMIIDLGPQRETSVEKSSIPVVRAIRPKYSADSICTDSGNILSLEIVLDKLRSSQGLDLSLSRDYLHLRTRSEIYELCLRLNYPVLEDTCKANFDRDTRVLHLIATLAQDSNG